MLFFPCSLLHLTLKTPCVSHLINTSINSAGTTTASRSPSFLRRSIKQQHLAGGFFFFFFYRGPGHSDCAGDPSGFNTVFVVWDEADGANGCAEARSLCNCLGCNHVTKQHTGCGSNTCLLGFLLMSWFVPNPSLSWSTSPDKMFCYKSPGFHNGLIQIISGKSKVIHLLSKQCKL